MGLFDKLKSAVGVGSPTLELGLVEPTFASGIPIQGSILITAQERPTPVKSITIKLSRVVDAKMSDGSSIKRTEVAGECVLDMGNRTLAAKEGARFPFTLDPGTVSADLGTVYELHASADTPGLDPKTSLAITLVAPPETPVGGVGPHDKQGLMAVDASFDTYLAQHLAPGSIAWIPRFGEAAYAHGQTFERADLSPDVLAALSGRVGFLEGEFGNSFGLFVTDAEGFTVISIEDGMSGTSGSPLGYVTKIALAQFKGPAGAELTYRHFQRSLADKPGFDEARFAQQVESLRALS